MKKNPHAVALGRKGGIARAAKLSPERRKEIAEQAGLANKQKWANIKQKAAHKGR